MATNLIMLNVLIEREIESLKKEIHKAQTDFDMNNYAVDYHIEDRKSEFQDLLRNHGMDDKLITLIDIDACHTVQDFDTSYLQICTQDYELKVAQDYAKLCIDMYQILNMMHNKPILNELEGHISVESYQRYSDVEALLLQSPYSQWLHDITVFDVQKKIDETKFHFLNEALRDRSSESATFVLALQYHLLLKNLQIYLKRPYQQVDVEPVIRRYYE